MSPSTPTAAEVAAKAGVSRMTVYRVINRDPKVSPQTASAVQQAMRHLNFVPSTQRNAQALGFDTSFNSLRHRRFAFLIPDVNVAALQTPLTGRLLQGIDTVLAPRGLDLSLTRLPSQRKLPELITSKGVDGVIIRSNVKNDYPIGDLKSLPCVWLMESRDHAPPGDVVHTDDISIGRLAAESVLRKNLNEVLVISESAPHDSYSKRIKSFTATLEGTNTQVHQIETHNKSMDHVAAMIKDFILQNPKAQAFFLPGTKPIISRIHQALISCGRDPEDVTVISASYDSEVTESLHPKPIHIDSLPEQLGEAAAELLLWRLSHPNSTYRRVSLSPKIASTT